MPRGRVENFLLALIYGFCGRNLAVKGLENDHKIYKLQVTSSRGSLLSRWRIAQGVKTFANPANKFLVVISHFNVFYRKKMDPVTSF